MVLLSFPMFETFYVDLKLATFDYFIIRDDGLAIISNIWNMFYVDLKLATFDDFIIRHNGLAFIPNVLKIYNGDLKLATFDYIIRDDGTVYVLSLSSLSRDHFLPLIRVLGWYFYITSDRRKTEIFRKHILKKCWIK